MSPENRLSQGLKFEVISPDERLANGARLARLEVPNRRPMETPNFLATTSRGILPHITPDLLIEHLKIQGVHLALEDFTERSTLGVIPPITQSPANKVSPLYSFTALPSQTLTVLAARRTPAVSSPTGNSDTTISTFTSTGFQHLSSEDYAKYIQTLQPDIAISLADIPTSGKANSTKRLDKMTDRTTRWLKEFISSRQGVQDTDVSAIFAPILPIDAGNQTEYFEYLADDLSGEFQGLAFYSTNLVPDIPPTTTLSKLPRLSLENPSSPHQIIQQISLGIDLMVIPFITSASEAGIALDFQFSSSPPSKIGILENGCSNVLPLGTNLWSSPASTSSGSPHSINTLPLSSNCLCYTCTNHSIAYLHHLLSAKEMLAWTLLQIHNHHVLSEFFASIRTSIKEERFEDDCKVFERTYETALPEKTGQGPRVRGYHFRSEGPGEVRKNEKSWGGLYLMGEGKS